MGTQSILLFEEKAFWSLQGNTFLWLSVRKLTPFPSITAENQTLRSKKQGEQRFNYAFYTFTHSNSKPKIFRTSYSADTNVLEQENAWERWPKNGLQAKERREEEHFRKLDQLIRQQQSIRRETVGHASPLLRLKRLLTWSSAQTIFLKLSRQFPAVRATSDFSSLL